MADPVLFDRSSAERIANAVRRVEIGDRAESPLRFDPVPPQQRKVFRIAKFSGAWNIAQEKTVTFKYQENTPNTAVVTNLFFPWPAIENSPEIDCAIAKDGTSWFLIDVPMETGTAIFASATATAAAIAAMGTAMSLATTARQTVISSVLVHGELETSGLSVVILKTVQTVLLTVMDSTSLASIMQCGTAQQTVVSDVQIAATLNTDNCQITISRTQTTAKLTVVQSTSTTSFITFRPLDAVVVQEVLVESQLETGSLAVTVSRTQRTAALTIVGTTATIATVRETAPIIVMQSTFTSNFLRLRL